MNRRTFLAATVAGLAPAARLAQANESANAANPIRLGGPISTRSDDPELLARAHRERGYAAAYCPNIPLKETDRIRATAAAFRNEGVVIAEVGRWVNLMDADAGRRAANLAAVTEGLALAEAIGALCCVDIAGSFNPTSWFGPDPRNLSGDFFDAAVENARKIIDAVQPQRAKFTYEVMGWSIPDSPESYLKLIRAIDRKGFGVHMDACNLVNSPRKFYQNGAMIRDAFEKLGPWMVSCHAKDLAWEIEMNVHFREVRPGLGRLDYKSYLGAIARLPQPPPLMLEHLPNAAEYDAAREYLFKFGRAAGFQFA